MCYCFCLAAKLCATPQTTAQKDSLSFTISWRLCKLRSIESVTLSNHLILCPSLLLPSIFPTFRVFSSESALPFKGTKYQSLSISNSNEYSGLISFRIDQFDLRAVQRALKSLLQHHNQKVSILWHSSFFMVQFSHPYMTTGKNIVLIRCLCFLIHCQGLSSLSFQGASIF